MITTCNRLNFIHVPKTGGTSIVSSLIDCGVEFKQLRGELPSHYSNSLILHYFPEAKNATSVAILRHPYEIFVSLYHYQRDVLEKENQLKIPEYVSFKQWMEEYVNNPYRLDNLELKGGLDYVDGVEFIFKYEHIKKAWKKILEILELPKNTPLKRINSTNHKPAIEYFDSNLKKIAVNVAWEAFEKMGWEI